MPRLILLAVIIAIGLLFLDSFLRRQRKRSDSVKKQAEDDIYKELLYNYQLAKGSGSIEAIRRSGIELADSPFATKEDLDMVYSDALSLISDHPELHEYAFYTGRRRYAFDKPKGVLSSSDEASILDEIEAASS